MLNDGGFLENGVGVKCYNYNYVGFIKWNENGIYFIRVLLYVWCK